MLRRERRGVRLGNLVKGKLGKVIYPVGILDHTLAYGGIWVESSWGRSFWVVYKGFSRGHMCVFSAQVLTGIYVWILEHIISTIYFGLVLISHVFR